MEGLSATFWWVATGVAVAAELVTGTFYLLMIALGLAAAAIAAQAGSPATWQIVAAALVGGGATAGWHWRRTRAPEPVATRSNRDVNLDVGERLHVDGWEPDRSARVAYRGSTWTAQLAPGAAAGAGEHVIVAVERNGLVLAPLPAAAPPRAAAPVADPRSGTSSRIP